MEGTEEQKARMRRYKAKVRAGIVKPKKRYKVTAWANRAREVASKSMDKAIRDWMARVHPEEVVKKGGKR